MAARHNMALTMFGSDISLRDLAMGIIVAHDEAEAEGVPPEADAAVLLLGYQLSFITHADSMPRRMVQDLIRICESNKSLPVDYMLVRSH